MELGVQHAFIEATKVGRDQPLSGRGNRYLKLVENRTTILCARHETLLFYSLVKQLRRPYHLTCYNSSELKALTGKDYAFHTIDRHLREMAKLQKAKPMGDALARCYYLTWYARDQAVRQIEHLLEPYVFYLDAHEKPIWSRENLPQGMVGSKPSTCLRQVFLHGRFGHTLYCKTYPGDTKLVHVTTQVITEFEEAIRHKAVHVIVIDREGLSLKLFKELAHCGAYIVTLLRSNQYSGVADFEELSEVRSLIDERTGYTTHRVAEGYFRYSDGSKIRCAVARDLENGKLVVFTTTVPKELEPDILQVARWYLRRWNAQENSFRYLVEFVHLDTNFGLNHKVKVANRVIERKIFSIQKRLSAQQKKLSSKQAKLSKLEGKLESLHGRQREALAKLAGHRLQERATSTRQSIQQKYNDCLIRWTAKRSILQSQIEHHSKLIHSLEKSLADINPNEPLYEINPEKDQIMTHFKVALANSALYAREHYFTPKYQKALPQTLQRIFFSQDGFVKETQDGIFVQLDPYKDPKLQANCVEACNNFNQRNIKTFDGKSIKIFVNCK